MMTMRNQPRAPFLLVLLGLLTLFLSGCATPGPLCGYYITHDERDQIVQFDPAHPTASTHAQKSYLRTLDIPLGLAYDPFTDHFFIRLQPGDFFLVVDRPARRIKRTFTLSGFEMPRGAGDLTIRSRDRHLFITVPGQPSLIETNINGRYVRTIDLPGLRKPAVGVAYDQVRQRLLTINQEHRNQIDIRTLDGQIESTLTLDRLTIGHGLAFDSNQREYYVTLAHPYHGLGVFSENGQLKRTLPLPQESGRLFFDVGPRSFLRLF